MDPAPGECWIVGESPTGAWTGQEGALAGWSEGGWRFVAPHDGLVVWIASNGEYARYSGSEWAMGELAGARVTIGGVQVVGAQSGAIAEPTGGSIVDGEARVVIAGILAALRGHGLVAG